MTITPPLNPCFLIAAAGQSRRFGSCKLQSLLPTGLSVLETTLQKISQVTAEMYLLSSSDNSFVQTMGEKYQCKNLVFPGKSPGLGDTLGFGVKSTSAVQGWIICLADMPFISFSTYKRLYNAAPQANIIVPTYHGRHGHPVYFSSCYREELSRLSGDTGAKKIVVANPQDQRLLVCDDKGIFADIDTPGDLRGC